MINAFDKWELAPGNRTRSVRTNEIAQTPLEVSIEGSRTLISHLPSALIINHQSVLNSHPWFPVSSVSARQVRDRAYRETHRSRGFLRNLIVGCAGAGAGGAQNANLNPPILFPSRFGFVIGHGTQGSQTDNSNPI